MERYDSYKDSGVEWIGEIPSGWKVVRLKAVCSPSGEVSPYEGGDYIALENIESFTGRRLEATISDFPEGMVSHYGSDVVLFGKLRPYLQKVYLPSEPGSCSTEIWALCPKSVSREFLFWCLNNAAFIDAVNATTYGAKMPRANWGSVGRLSVALPSLNEQRAIAAYLDDKTAQIDALVGDVERSIGLLEECRASVISEAVTKGLDPDAPMRDSGVEWIGEMPSGWAVQRINRVAQTSSGATPSRGKEDAYFEDATIDWVRTLDLNNGYVSRTSEKITERALREVACKVMPPGTVCVAMYGGTGTIGKFGVLAIPACTNQAICSISCGDCLDPGYLGYVLTPLRPYWMKYSAGTRKDPNISQEVVGKMTIPIPPIDEQRAIASYLDERTAQIDALIAKKRELAERLREYRKSLVSEAVTGKFRVTGTE